MLRIRRRAVVAAMRRAGLPDGASAMYRDLGTSLCELLWLGGRSPTERAHALDAHFTMEESLLDAIAEARARGPVVLAASHTANWEVVAFGAARVFEQRFGARLALVVKDISVGAFQAFCTRLREACGLTLISEHVMTRGRQHLAAGDIVGMVIDQVPARERHGVRVPFLGAPALVDRAPEALAKHANATLIVLGARRDGDHQHLELLASLSPASVVEATRALDAFVRRNPSSWLWLHRRWRDPLPTRIRPDKHVTCSEAVS